MEIMDIDLENWHGPSNVYHSYKPPLPADQYNDKAATLTERQAVFYRNLIKLALKLQTAHLPVSFGLPDGRNISLDRGCIKIAEHARFIMPLENNSQGVVTHITLAWRV